MYNDRHTTRIKWNNQQQYKHSIQIVTILKCTVYICVYEMKDMQLHSIECEMLHRIIHGICKIILNTMTLGYSKY